jgi:hypothetical protein
MLRNVISYAASALQPWVWPAAAVAAGSFPLFLILRLWACGPGLRLVKSTRAGAAADGHPSPACRLKGALLRGFVWLVAFGSTQLRRLSLTCAVVACAGFLAVTFASPSQAGAGEALLSQAQQALQTAIPADYAKVANLAAPEVTTKDGSTTFTFRVPGKSGSKSAKAKTYSVTIGPGGVAVRQTP